MSPTPAANIDEEKDPLEEMLDRTGCKEVHYSLQVSTLVSFGIQMD